MNATRTRAALERALPEWARCGLALLVVGACFGLRWSLQSYLSASAYLLFIPGLLLSARVLGRRPTILATLVSALLGTIYFLPLYGEFHIDQASEAIPFAIFIAVALFTTEMVERLNDANMRLRLQMIEIERARAEVAEISAQRELLLEKINHRIKNHLQSVAGLAGMAERKSTSHEEAKAALNAFQARL